MRTLFVTWCLAVLGSVGCGRSHSPGNPATPTQVSVATAAAAERQVTGKVSDLDGTLLAGVEVSALAEVSAVSGRATMITDSTGAFSIAIGSEIRDLRFARHGYETQFLDVHVNTGDSITFNVYLPPL